MRTACRMPLERIARFDREVRAGRYPNAKTLARELEVHPRTIHRDITFLRDRLGAPLAYDALRHGFYYTDASYRLPALALTEAELLTLILAERLFRQYSGTPYAEQLDRAIRRMAEMLSEEVTIDLSQLDRALSFHADAPPPIDPSRFQALLAATAGHHRLAIQYRDQNRRSSHREIDPYHLTAISGAWYLVAYCHLRGDLRLFVPDRIVTMSPTGATFEPDPQFSIHAYLASSLSVFHGEPGEHHQIVLRFRNVAANTVRERPLHASQRLIDEPDGAVRVTLELSHLREAERLALSWGGDCEVLAPSGLRQRLARELQRAAAQYQPVAATDSPPARRTPRT